MKGLRTITLQAPAKINWTLAVLGRRPDGYHEIDTVMQTISLHDTLEISPIRRAECRIECADPSIPTDDSNLIHRAWQAMREARPGCVGGVRVKLTKRIPSGAGLGGGSSDAAKTLIAINRLFALRIPRSELAGIAAAIGSDVPFFIYGGAARCRGRGEIIECLTAQLAHIPLVVAFPGFSSPTAEAYGRLTPRDFGGTEFCDQAARAIERGNAKQLVRSAHNAFDEALSRSEPRYKKLKSIMVEAALERPMLSGSGSACFAIAPNAAEAKCATAVLEGSGYTVFRSRA